MGVNWLDAVMVLIVVLGALAGVRRGFLRGTLDVVLVVIGLLAGAVGYHAAARLITSVADRSGVAVNIIAFAVVALIVQGILSIVASVTAGPVIGLVRGFSPVRRIDELLGVVPGVVKGLVVAALLVLAASLIPLGARADTALGDSRFAQDVLTRAASVTFWAQERTGLNLADFTVVTEPSTDEGYRLPFRVTQGLKVSQADEQEMLRLVNEERQRRGLAPLTLDPQLQAIAREHSREMLELGYFSHVSPVSGSPADRLQAAGIRYTVAGENLAYAPTVEIAHRSFMQSSGHRANILSPDFQRIGIGVIVSPTGGKMFTQEFTGE